MNDEDECEESYMLLQDECANAQFSLLENPELVNCFMNLPEEDSYLHLPSVNRDKNPLNMEYVNGEQINDDELAKWQERYPER